MRLQCRIMENSYLARGNSIIFNSMDHIFFNNWQSLGRTFIITILGYIIMILFLRVSGKRTLSKMNAFDFIVTIALGSSLATVALNKSVPLIEGALVFFLLIFLQFTITWISVRTGKFRNLVTSQPILLLYRGKLFPEILKKERITVEEVHMALRKKGIEELEKVDAIIMETTGDIVVIPNLESKNAVTLEHVQKPLEN